MTRTVWRGCDSDAEAIRLGFPNLATYRHAVRCEIEREERQAYADAVGQHNAELAQRLQGQGPGHTFRTAPLTTMQAEAARARRAEYGQGDSE
jgi:hypothetical protein